MKCHDQELQTLTAAPCLRLITRNVDGGLTVYDHAALVLVAVACFLLGIGLFLQMRARFVRWARAP